MGFSCKGGDVLSCFLGRLFGASSSIHLLIKKKKKRNLVLIEQRYAVYLRYNSYILGTIGMQ